MHYVGLLFTCLLTAGLSYLLSRQNYLLDQPNHRSMHARAIPRSGGLALLMAITLSIVVEVKYADIAAYLTGLSTALLVLLPLSYLDDHIHVPSHYRLTSQLITAGILVHSYAPQTVELLLLTITSPYWVNGGLILCVIWMINLYNFMDGMNGIAGGMASIGLVCLAILGLQADAYLYAQIAFIVAAACAGFLMINLSSSPIFMGDLGSTLLGAIIATLILWGSKIAVISLPISVLIFSPFIVDTTVTLIQRMLRKEKVWTAHNTHYYQRLTRKIGQEQTLLWEYALMVVCALLALWINSISATNQAIILLTCLGLYGLLCSRLEHICKEP